MAQKRNILKKPVFLFLFLVALGGGAAWFWTQQHAAQDRQAAEYTLVTVDKGNLADIVTAQGKLEPRDYVDVGSQVSGQLEKVHVDIGDVVQAGDLLAEIDPEIYEARVKADEARLKTLNAQRAQQIAQVESARHKFTRNEKLIKSKAVSQDLFEDSETALKVAEAQLLSLDAQIEEAQSTLEGDLASLGYTKIYAPMGGTVVSQSSQEGQTLNASQSAPVLVQLANLDIMTVRAQVAEADVMRLKPGMNVYFTTLGSQDRQWNGTIRQILPTPEIINDVVLYNVLVDVDNEDRQLMTGMSTQMFFVLGEADDVMLVPVSALGKRVRDQDNDWGQAYNIRVLRGRILQDQVVHVGLMDRTRAEIRHGLAVGDQVAVSSSRIGAQITGAASGRTRMPRL